MTAPRPLPPDQERLARGCAMVIAGVLLLIAVAVIAVAAAVAALRLWGLR